MKWCGIFLLLALFMIYMEPVQSQCSICTKTAQQMGEKPARGLNAGIIYLAAAPLLIVGYIGYRWFRNNHNP
ncbi:MAG TPA: hypothetical protein VM012_08580 [Flavitalea sp.]|nr:hypothetical protein [Flavitalea sp.]